MLPKSAPNEEYGLTLLRRFIGLRKTNPEIAQVLENVMAQAKPYPYHPQTGSVVTKQLSVDDESFAQQITIREWKYFLSINPEEFHNCNWSNKKSKNQLAQNLCLFIKWTNTFCSWVSGCIVTEKHLEKRVQIMQRMILLAYNLFKVNNFNGAMEVYSALSNKAIYRLKQTRDALSSKCKACYQELENYFSPDNNYKAYREILRQAPHPKIPFLGFCLTDITFIYEGIKKTTKSINDPSIELINIDLYRKFGKSIAEVFQCRESNYTFRADSLLLSLYEPSEALSLLTSADDKNHIVNEDGETIIYTDRMLEQMSKRIEPPTYN